MPDDPITLPRRPERRTLLAFLLVTATVAGACAGAASSPVPPPLASAPRAFGGVAAVAPVVRGPARSTDPELALLQASPSPASSGIPASPDASVAPLASLAPVPEPTFDPALSARLQAVVDASRGRIPTPGLSVAVRMEDGRAWAGVAGDRLLDPPKPVDPDTVFAIASITKTFVTAVVMQLVDEGRLSLDDRLAAYLPDYPRAGRITIRELLGHTSGVYDYFENPAYNRQVFANRDRVWTPQQILRFVLAPYCDPGACFHYSNANFVLLGLVVEKVTGRPLSASIRKRLLDPLGLQHIVFQSDEPTPRDAAHGHLWGGGDLFYDQIGKGRVIPNRSASTVAWAAGAMASSASDLARWADALYGGRVVSPESLAAMLTFRKADAYGLGTRTNTFAKHTAVGHLGGIRGYELAMWHFPDVGATIVVLTNRGIFSTDKTVKLLAKALYAGLDAAAATSPAPSASPLPSASPAPAG